MQHSDIERWANMAIAMRNASDSAGLYQAKGGLLCRIAGPGTIEDRRTMTYYAAPSEGRILSVPLHRSTIRPGDELAGDDLPDDEPADDEPTGEEPPTHWDDLPVPLRRLSEQETTAEDLQATLIAMDVETRVCRWDGRVLLPCVVRDGTLFAATDCRPGIAHLMTDRERLRRALSRVGLRMIEPQDDWEAELDAAGDGLVTFTIGTHGGPRIPREADGRAGNIDGATAPIEAGLSKGEVRRLFDAAVSNHFSKPGEWRCEAYGVKGNGTGIDADEPLDATDAFAPHFAGARLSRGDALGDDVLVRASDGMRLNAEAIMAAGADDWAARS